MISQTPSYAPVGRFTPMGADAPEPTVHEYDNGVRTWTEGQTDVYELPQGTEDVPRRISVEHRPWWQGGDAVHAAGADDRPLAVRRQGCAFFVTDARSGVTTRLDSDSMKLTVRGPVSETRESIPKGDLVHTHCVLEEQVSPGGDIRILADRHVYDTTKVYGYGAEASVQFTRQDDFDEILIPRDGDITIHRHREREPAERGELTARIDQGAALFVTDEERREQVYPLYIAPHALAQNVETQAPPAL